MGHPSARGHHKENVMNLWKPIALCSVAGLVLSLGVQVAHAEPGGQGGAVAGRGVCHDQPNMAAALTSLRAARASLEKAEHNKGGWRGKAIESADAAIRETDRGCAFANTH